MSGVKNYNGNPKPNFESIQIPVGTHSSHLNTNPPETPEVFVGRHHLRTRFITLLLQSNKNLSLLVTGQRGAGKSSFVEHCLNEYKGFKTQYFLKPENNSRLKDFFCFISIFLCAYIFFGIGVLSFDQAIENVQIKRILMLILTGFLVLEAYKRLQTIGKCTKNIQSCKKAILGRKNNIKWYLYPNKPIKRIVSGLAQNIGKFLVGIVVLSVVISSVFTGEASAIIPNHSKILTLFQESAIYQYFSGNFFLHNFESAFFLLLVICLLVLTWLKSKNMYRRNTHRLLSLTLPLLAVAAPMFALYLNLEPQAFENYTESSILFIAFVTLGTIPVYSDVFNFFTKFIFRIISLLGASFFATNLHLSDQQVSLLVGITFLSMTLVSGFETKRFWKKFINDTGRNTNLASSVQSLLNIQILVLSLKYLFAFGFLFKLYLAFSQSALGFRFPEEAALPALLSTWTIIKFLTIFVFLYFLEYVFIVKENVRSVYEHVRFLKVSEEEINSIVQLDNKNLDETTQALRDDINSQLVRCYRLVNGETLPNFLVSLLRVVIIAPLNLGFKEVEQKSVIVSMLSVLSNEYSRCVSAINSLRGMFLKLPILLFIIFLTCQLYLLLHQALTETKSLDWVPENLHQMMLYPIVACSFDNIPHHYELIKGSAANLFLVPVNNWDLGVNLYFLIILACLFLSLKKVRFFHLDKSAINIRKTIEKLSATRSINTENIPWKFAQYLSPITGESKENLNSTTSPQDPRILEHEFLASLKLLASRKKGIKSWLFPSPQIEVNFVLDELDKIGGKHEMIAEKSNLDLPEALKNDIAHRQLLIENLLSDLKNIITKGEARFIFIGGREINDTWLTDHTDKNPLFTSIFSYNIYIPSLLNDDSNIKDDNYHLNSLVRLYFLQQYKKSQRISKSISRSLTKSISLEGAKATEPNTYTFQGAYDSLTNSFDKMFRSTYFTDSIMEIHPVTLFQMDGENAYEIGEEFDKYKGRLVQHMCNYLAYRSQGYPKKLEEMLSELIGPIMQTDDRAITPRLNEPLYGKDALKLSDIQLIRIQFLASLFGRHIQVMGNYAISDRDDKTVNLLFAISDFIFKFHRRAFSSDSLEKIEFLVSSHQDPTVRLIVDNVVNFFKDLFLQRIRAGLYGYTFRSEVSNELKYLSAFSPTEMAAFNFTNDESYSLKNTYIAKLKDGNMGNFDLTSFLAEVYEFDEEFAVARKEYFRSLKALEANMTLSQEKVLDLNNLNAFFVVKLLLKIGMSYELSNDLDKASAAYEDAKTYCMNTADKIIKMSDTEKHMLRLIKPIDKETDKESNESPDGNQPIGRVSVISRLFLQLFQSIFAQAWLHEKLQNNVETSTVLIEHSIDRFLNQIPNVSATELNTEPGQTNSAPNDLENSEYIDLILLKAEALNKAGDLYFVKGKPVLYTALTENAPNIIDYITGQKTQLSQKYLQRAETMYVNGFFEIKSAYLKMRPSTPSAEESQLDPRVVFPAFITRCLCGTLQDISDTLCARLSLLEVWSTNASAKELNTQYKEIGSALTNAISSTVQPKPLERCTHPFKQLLGLEVKQSDDANVDYLLSSLSTNHKTSNLLYHGGYPEDAGREYLRGVDTAVEMLMWRMSLGIVNHYIPKSLKDASDNGIDGRNLSSLMSESGLDFFLLYESTRRLAGVLSHKVYEVNKDNENEVLSFTSRYFIDLVRGCISTLMLATFYPLKENPSDFLQDKVFAYLKAIIVRLLHLPIDLPELQSFAKQIEETSIKEGWPMINKSYSLFSQCMKHFLEQYRYPIFNRIHSLYCINLLDLVYLHKNWENDPTEKELDFDNDSYCKFHSYPDKLITVIGRALPDEHSLRALAQFQKTTNSVVGLVSFNDEKWHHLNDKLRDYEITWKTLRLLVDDPKCFSFLTKDAYTAELGEAQKSSLENYRQFLLSHSEPGTFALHFCNQGYFRERVSAIFNDKKERKLLEGKIYDVAKLFETKMRDVTPEQKKHKTEHKYIDNQNYKNLNNLIYIKDNHSRVISRIDEVNNLMFDLNILGEKVSLASEAVKLQQQQFELKDAHGKLNQLNQLVRKFNAPMYVPHYQLGLLKTLYYLMRRHWEKDVDEDFHFGQNTRREGHDELQKSVSSHSQRREYYESIQKLYYFYDDFNDRNFHAIQARKMLFSDYAEMLLVIHDAVIKERLTGDNKAEIEKNLAS